MKSIKSQCPIGVMDSTDQGAEAQTRKTAIYLTSVKGTPTKTLSIWTHVLRLKIAMSLTNPSFALWMNQRVGSEARALMTIFLQSMTTATL